MDHKTLIAIGILFLTGSLSFASVPASGARVAVVDLTKSPERADLLTVALAKTDGIAVVERAQMDKLVAEQQLQALETGGKFSALGKLLGADGLAILENFPDGHGKSQPTVRLIAVATGACIMLRDFPATADPDGNIVAWIAHSVGESVPALTKKVDGLVPVAIVSIRSELTSKASGELDRALKSLLEKQLGGTPGLLLLERRQLGAVAFDKDLDASDAQPLLKGAIVIEATLTTPAADGGFTLRADLRRTDGTLAKAVKIEAAVSALPAAIEQLAAGIVEATGVPPIVGAPTHFREGRRFLLEAGLAWRADDREAAEEALSAARILGAPGPGLPWLALEMAQAALDRQTANIEWPLWLPVYQNRRPNGLLTANWDEVRATADETLADLAGFRASILVANHEPKLSFNLNETLKFYLYNRTNSWDNYYYFSAQDSLNRLCLFLWQRDLQGDPTVEPLRLQLRRLAEELKGLRPSPLAFDWLTDVPFPGRDLPIPLFARDRDELLSWYEKIFRWNQPIEWQQLIPRDEATALGPRFIRQPGTVEAWHALLRRLADDPATSLRVRLYQIATLESAEGQSAYLAILDAMGRRAAELQQSG
jgi:hypothetical protein